MSKLELLKSVVTQRLGSAGADVVGLLQRAVADDEHALSGLRDVNAQQRKLLDAASNPDIRLHAADVQQLLVQQAPPQQPVQSSSLDQEDPEPPHIKEDQELQSGPGGPRAPPH